jgi:hypothetical protein
LARKNKKDKNLNYEKNRTWFDGVHDAYAQLLHQGEL